MEPRQSRRVGSINRENAGFAAGHSRCRTFSIEINQETERAGDRLYFDHPLSRGGRDRETRPNSSIIGVHEVLLVALLEPDVTFAVPVDQRAGCLGLTHGERVATQVWDLCFTAFFGGTRFGVYLPGIHPLEVVATVADRSPCTENCHLASRAMNDRNPDLSRRTL